MQVRSWKAAAACRRAFVGLKNGSLVSTLYNGTNSFWFAVRSWLGIYSGARVIGYMELRLYPMSGAPGIQRAAELYWVELWKFELFLEALEPTGCALAWLAVGPSLGSDEPGRLSIP